MKRWWVSWYGAKGVAFTLHTPWWISGYRCDSEDGEDDTPTICAAVIAESEEAAKRLIVGSHDSPVKLKWRFVNVRPSCWSPFCERFPKADWMQWPEKEKVSEAPNHV